MGKLRPYSLKPPVDNQELAAFLDWVQGSLNELIGQVIKQGRGLDFLSKSTVDPTTQTLLAGGSRTASIVTAIKFVAGTGSVTFYWDGTNGSSPVSIYRDDGSVVTPIVGNQAVTGLSPSTKYFFYPFYDEALQKIVFASVPGAVGSPPVAYTAPNFVAAQQQILRGHTPMASALVTTGVTTPGAGTTSGSGGGGGGSVGARLGETL